MAGDEPVSLGPAKCLGEHFVGDALKPVEDILVTQAPFPQFAE